MPYSKQFEMWVDYIFEEGKCKRDGLRLLVESCRDGKLYDIPCSCVDKNISKEGKIMYLKAIS